MNEEILVKLGAINDFNKQDEGKKLLLEFCNTLSNNEIGELLNIYGSDKRVKANIVDVLDILGYPRIEKAIPYLLGFLLDTNWPGAEKAQQILGNLNPNIYCEYLNAHLKQALDTHDEDWIYFISLFISKYELRDYISDELYSKMKKLVDEYEK